VLLGLYAFQAYNCWNVNKELLAGRKQYPAEDRYRFKQVALLELAYVVNFGSELAVVTMLPEFFEGTFGLSKVAAGMIASSYAFMCLIARPSGGIISDSIGSRKWTLASVTGFMGIGYLLFSQVGSGWMLPLAVVMAMACSFFVQASAGATFAMVPLVKRRITGQIAGNVGAYGNVGAVAYLTILLLLKESLVPTGTGVDPAQIAAGNAQANAIFFQVLGVMGLMVASLCAFFLEEPKGSFAEAHEGDDLPAAEFSEGSDPAFVSYEQSP
jgi:MFS transporter, NNP family, nitrate/nitrite transporter